MVILYHYNNKIQEVLVNGHPEVMIDTGVTIAQGLHILAKAYPKTIIVWCDVDCKEYLNESVIETLFQHNKLMFSYHPHPHHFIDKRIGYVDHSVFVAVNKQVAYPTWHMSSLVGAVHASVLLAINDKITFDSDFDYYLNSLAKLAMPLGLFCYSETRLLKEHVSLPVTKTSIHTLFKFVKQHYKTRWVYLLFLNMMLYERNLPLFPLLYALCFTKRTNIDLDLNGISIKSSKGMLNKTTIDVVIPTIGRKTYLYDVLCDLRNQTHLPKQVIIVEQNPVEDSVSELDFLKQETWPFKIEHLFTHQSGACHARNLALEQVTSEWVFLADDDIAIGRDFLVEANDMIFGLPYKALTFRCYTKDEKKVFNTIKQWATFGSGCSIVHREALKYCSFSESFEHGFGEDADFGMQLRHNGYDIIYLPEPSILHLKAPIGGFRTSPKVLWQEEAIQPKPSPTIMLYNVLHKTKEQQLGYKTVLFLKYYKKQSVKNPFTYYAVFKKQWEQSVYYANKLKTLSQE